MASIELRELHLVKRALAIAVVVLERQPDPLKASSDLLDIKLLLERLASGGEQDYYMRLARMAVEPPHR